MKMEKSGVDTNELKQKVANLRKQCNEYDLLLKHLSLSYTDLPLNMQKELDEYALYKRKLGLHTMDMGTLSEFYCTNTERNIGKQIAILKARACNEQIEKDLAKTKSALIEAKSFANILRNKNKQCGEIDLSLRDANREINVFTEKKNKLEENIKVDVDRILMKLEQLAE
ncbi:uncharacterized protein LOC116338746 [Contarinia nasturtii]|uniref:uncharacterized protein LOC116338746 n=1 Tax=Contarinia nasturtii TaxID=265458 RepID=UPI0012D3E8BA|nr:uncharacterized protein LOC116338746 [Contarinia nasturtii]